MHLSWGDIHVAVDNQDQFGKGVEVYVGRTSCLLCPVAGTLAYMARGCFL